MKSVLSQRRGSRVSQRHSDEIPTRMPKTESATLRRGALRRGGGRATYSSVHGCGVFARSLWRVSHSALQGQIIWDDVDLARASVDQRPLLSWRRSPYLFPITSRNYGRQKIPIRSIT